MGSVKCFFDGACSGNPGKSGYGFLIKEDNTTIYRESGVLGRGTNNTAEYGGLIALLENLKQRNIRGAVIYGDSQLVVRQVQGQWKVKNKVLKPLHDKAVKLVKELEAEVRWVKREANTEADELARDAVYGGKKKKEKKYLKPCPFCGALPKKELWNADTKPVDKVVCRQFGCPIFGISFYIEDWNTRA